MRKWGCCASQGSLWSVIGHKLNSYLAFRVARVGGLAPSLGKLGHEKRQVRGAGSGPSPLVAPVMLVIALIARLLDRVLFDPEESLGFLVLARHIKPAAP